MRKWLERNKIFFETIAAIFLSGMALIISWAELKVTKFQTKIQEQTILPQFVISVHQIKSTESSPVYDQDVLTVENVGSIVRDFKSECVVVLEIEALSEITLNEVTLKYFLNGYYSWEILTAAGRGILSSTQGYKNNDRIINLERELRTSLEEHKILIDFTIKRYLKLRYIDLLGDRHIDYYFVPLIYGASLFPIKEGEEIFKSFHMNLSSPNFLEFDKLTSTDLEAKIVQAISQQAIDLIRE